MKAELDESGCVLKREAGDPRLYHESTVAYHLKRLLNAQGFHFTRMNPSRYGLTSCRVGLQDKKAKILLWHERYQIENAATEFNHGKVFLQRVQP